MKSSKVFYWFRKVAFIEGISFLVLLFIAMPLKYLADSPATVRIVGGIHGALFVAFMVLGVAVMYVYKKNLLWLTTAFFASILPFGTFIMEKKWKKEEFQFTN
jgi:integral membrane protein